jgi:proline dehydrogenase
LALYLLSHSLPPSSLLSQSIDEICQLAQERGVRLLIDGEQDVLQGGIDAWTVWLASKYNKTPGRASIFGTYQAYKRSTSRILSQHLAEAQKSGFTLGVKLVRGAYLRSEVPKCLFTTKADTDACYDHIAESILTRQWNSTIQGVGHFPHVSLMLATHNTDSIRRAYAICNAGKANSEVVFAQLQGMADEIGCELVKLNQSIHDDDGLTAKSTLPVYKYMAWGTTGECMKYLLRRAQENSDAIGRTRNDRDASMAELVRRVNAFIWTAR